ncbi:alpha/beta hydrolase [Achromobacter pestifer]|uniref:Ferri-bacillibactin esterase BesA n=1 Tax=Achromobacter pestifer TaxID=1353889 RepID=A0A6S6Z2Q7_9BURK|nr:alpha/beta hydrolase-fold protein [Achromobacter pestifer]CAB3654754.1 Ferri-bacillibactin esterase BesA [Achromobacter pestifer]
MAEHVRFVLTAAALLIGMSAPAQAQPGHTRPMAAQPPELAIGVPAAQVQRYVLAAPDGGPEYRVSVWAPPEGQPPAAGYPVIYMLDGNAVFESLARTTSALPPGARLQAVVVGIGYEDAERFNVTARSYDYTPPSPGADAPRGSPRDPDARGWAKPGGGADRFLAILQQRIQPLVERRYRVDAGNRTLYGHSYGGLFALHVALSRPQAFKHYVAASPSIWWNGQFILQSLAHPAAVPEPGVEVTVMAGEEAQGRDDQPDSPESVVRALDGVPRVRASLRVFPGLGHGEMLPASLAATLRGYVR